jgi:hypothetical protein
VKKFEYKVITIPTSIPLGAKGWELVQRADGFFFFKRELPVE